MTGDSKDRIAADTIWIAWGCIPIAWIWSDAIPYGGQAVSFAWIAGLFFALCFTSRRFRKRAGSQTSAE